MSNPLFDELLQTARHRDYGVAAVAVWLKDYRVDQEPVQVVAEARTLTSGLTDNEIDKIIEQAEALSRGTTVQRWRCCSKDDDTLRSFIPQESLQASTAGDAADNFRQVTRLRFAARDFATSLQPFERPRRRRSVPDGVLHVLAQLLTVNLLSGLLEPDHE